jgi:hypothetical protein
MLTLEQEQLKTDGYAHWLKLVTDTVAREIARREALIQPGTAQHFLDRTVERKKGNR